MSSDYEISDDENEYYDEEDEELMDVDDGAYTRPPDPNTACRPAPRRSSRRVGL